MTNYDIMQVGDNMLDYEKYMTLSENIVAELEAHPSCQRYKQYQAALLHDEIAQSYIKTFEESKSAYEDVLRYGGKHHPDFKDVSNTLIEAKIRLFEYPLIQDIKQCEQEIQQLMNEISQTLTQMSEISEVVMNRQKKRCSH